MIPHFDIEIFVIKPHSSQPLDLLVLSLLLTSLQSHQHFSHRLSKNSLSQETHIPQGFLPVASTSPMPSSFITLLSLLPGANVQAGGYSSGRPSSGLHGCGPLQGHVCGPKDEQQPEYAPHCVYSSAYRSHLMELGKKRKEKEEEDR